MSIIYKYLNDFTLLHNPIFRLCEGDFVVVGNTPYSPDFSDLPVLKCGEFSKRSMMSYVSRSGILHSFFLKSKSIPRALRGGNFEVSCTTMEYKSYKKTAWECGFATLSAFVNASISAFMNVNISAIDVIRTQLEEAYKSKIYCVNTLNQIGNNLNQISRNVNTAHYNGDAANWVEVHEELIKIYMLVHLLLAKIRTSEQKGGDNND